MTTLVADIEADGLLPDGVPWKVTVEPIPETYIEGGAL